MGAEFLEVKIAEDGDGGGGYAKEMSPAFIAAEMALFLEQAREVDVIVTTALIPGKRAPILVTEEAVRAMRPGSVVVDLAAEMGGNCALTTPGGVADVGGVKIVGYTDMASRMAEQASQLYGVNLCHLLDDMGKAEKFSVDMGDEVVRPMTVCHDGAVTWPPPPSPVKPAAPVAKPAPAPAAPPAARACASHAREAQVTCSTGSAGGPAKRVKGPAIAAVAEKDRASELASAH